MQITVLQDIEHKNNVANKSANTEKLHRNGNLCFCIGQSPANSYPTHHNQLSGAVF